MKYKETQTMELKREFKWKQCQKEISGLLNSNPIGTEISLVIGVSDNGVEYSEYKKKDESETKDYIVKMLVNNFVKHSFVDLKNGGFILNATVNEAIIMANGSPYIRSNTTTTQVQTLESYKKILMDKKIEFLAPTIIEFNSDHFRKLSIYLESKHINKTLKEYLIDTNAIVMGSKKLYRSLLAEFLKDDSELKIRINDEVITAPIFELFDIATSKLIDHAEKTKILSKNGMTRFTLIEGNKEIGVLIREMLSNLFVHSHYKLLGEDCSMTIEFQDDVISMSNKHSDPKLETKVNTKVIPSKVHNINMFSMMKQLHLVEGEKIGFKLFFANEKHFTWDITTTDYKITYKGDA